RIWWVSGGLRLHGQEQLVSAHWPVVESNGENRGSRWKRHLLCIRRLQWLAATCTRPPDECRAKSECPEFLYSFVPRLRYFWRQHRYRKRCAFASGNRPKSADQLFASGIFVDTKGSREEHSCRNQLSGHVGN